MNHGRRGQEPYPVPTGRFARVADWVMTRADRRSNGVMPVVGSHRPRTFASRLQGISPLVPGNGGPREKHN